MSAHAMRLSATRFATVIAVAAAAASMSGVATPIRAGEPLRSGKILSAAADTAAYSWIWAWDGCSGSAECLPWLVADCSVELAGRNPAVMSSIEPVRDLADGATPRTLQIATSTPTALPRGKLIVEFWDSTCRDIVENRAAYGVPCSKDCPKFQIPVKAHWMTITSKPGNANIEWKLT